MRTRGILAAAVALCAVSAGVGCRRAETPPQPSGSASRSLPPMPAGDQLSYASVVERVAPSVVTIRSERRVRAPRQFPFPFPLDPSFRDFFGTPNQSPGGGIQRGLGSGVIADENGHCVTNHHVVDGAEDIKVEFSDGRTYDARLVGSDPPSDLAVLKIEARNLKALPPGNSDAVRIGDIALAVGNPLGIGQTVTLGIISAKGRTTGLSDGSFEDFLQTDAPINQGNSGGALVNTNAELIGINSQILSPSGGNIGIGFAIPSNMVRNVMGQLIEGGKVRRGHLGVGIQRVTSDIAGSVGLKEARGVIVNSVTPGSPADKAGLRRGDVILSVNGEQVVEGNALRNRIASSKPGDQVNLTVWRDGKEQQLRVTLGEFQMPGDGQGGSQRPGNSERDSGRLGITVQPLTPEVAARLGLARGTTGVLVGSVMPAGPAAAAGIQPGDVIVEVSRKPVNSPEELRRALEGAGSQPVLMLINRRGQTVFVTARPRE